MVLQIDVSEAWKILQQDPNSLLIDVRTKEEIDFVGFVDSSKACNRAIHLPWKQYPQMTTDEDFVEKLSTTVNEIFPSTPPEQIKLFFMCRSGNRSLEAAMFMYDLGYCCYNIKDGFEGSLDEYDHRGSSNGWKASKLPWRQN